MIRAVTLVTLFVCFLYANPLKHDKSLVTSSKALKKIAFFDKRVFKYTINDYLKNPLKNDFLLSPKGKYLSFFQMKKDGKYLALYDINKNKDKILLKEEGELIRGYVWANEDTIIFSKDKAGDENYKIFSIDIKSKKVIALTPFENVQVNILAPLTEDKEHIIILMNKNTPEIFEPYKINIKTGKLEQLFENKDLSSPIIDYYFDKNGLLKAYVKLENQTQNVLYYMKNNSKEFEKIKTINWKDEFQIIEFNYGTKYEDDAYVLVKNKNNNTSTLILYDFIKKKKIKRLYSHSKYDLSGLLGSKIRNYEIDYFTYFSDKFTIVPQSKFYKKLDKKFRKKFPKIQYNIVDRNQDETKYLLLVSSDRIFGTYYLYDLKKDSFQKLINLKPYLKKEDMAKMIPITFKSRDDLEIHGYLTLPNGIKNPPLIVNPHGGPYGERDIWGFNSEVQLFASSGYATLQINYRGSGGYGREFELKGYKQIGRAMLNDLEDGVKYVKNLGVINKNKIAIYGASYGGLATLGSLVKTPNLYTCGVDYVGVSNLITFFKSFPAYWKPLQTQVFEQWYNPNNEDELKIIKKVSPFLNVDKISKDVLVIQGANDPRVNILESDQMVRALRKKGLFVPYMVKYDEGHGFHKVANNIELYNVMLGFFHKCFNTKK